MGTSGIAWVNDKLFLVDWQEGKLLRCHLDSVEDELVIEKSYTGTYNFNHFYGIGWDGTHLWVGDYTDGWAYYFNQNLELQDRYISPGFHPTGWAYDGTYLSNSDTSANRIFKTYPPD